MKPLKVQPSFDEFPSYKGGNTILYGGYVWEFCPGHRLQNAWGFVAQHRLIGEYILGRPLERHEVVHHRDEVRTNNHPDNLQVMTQREHRSHHGRRMAELNLAPITKEMVEKALDGRSLKNAARLLKVDTQTLRNRFPELALPRQRKSPTVIDDPDAIAAVLRAAPDPAVSLKEVSQKLRMSQMTILRICKRNGVEWVRKPRDKSTYPGRPLDGHGPDVQTVLAYAKDPTKSVEDACQEIGVSTTTVTRICRKHGVAWVRKDQDAVLRSASQQQTEAGATCFEPAAQ